MTPETVSLIAAIIFLLVAVVGGGITVKEVVIPLIPGWARIVSASLGVVFAIPFMFNLDDPPARHDADEVTVHTDTQFDTSPEGIRLSGLQATSVSSQPHVGDRITIKFTLVNMTDKPFKMAFTFLGGRDDANSNKDFGYGNHGLRLAPYATLTVKGSIVPDSPGIWKFWPCYAFARNNQEMYCPPEWKAFQVSVRP